MPKDTVQTLGTEGLSERAGEDVMGYLNKRASSNESERLRQIWPKPQGVEPVQEPVK